MFTSSNAECAVYDGNVKSYALPKLNKNFVTGVESLTPEYNEKVYLNFVEFFGTHYILHVKMGSKFGFVSEFSEEGWRKLTSDTDNIEQAASNSGWLQSGSNRTMTHSQEEDVENFN